MSKPVLLTKSRFKIGLECPRKLYYTINPEKYANSAIDDPFLEALADGGFQVGALAREYFPDGIEVVETVHEKALTRTATLLQASAATVFEAAVGHGDLFVRVDVLSKQANLVDLIEVKAKSISVADGFLKKRQPKENDAIAIDSEWSPYLYDIAFQTHVTRLAHPEWKVRAHLMLADKDAVASVDGLNQRFVLRKVGNRTRVLVKPGGHGDRLLRQIDVTDIVDNILASKDVDRYPLAARRKWNWIAEVEQLRQICIGKRRPKIEIGEHCRGCEFRASPVPPMKSGFDECWSGVEGYRPGSAVVLDIWNLRGAGDLISSGKAMARDLTKADIRPDLPIVAPLSPRQRQWLQVESYRKRKPAAFFDRKGLRQALRDIRFPLHFIDFETVRVAVPFNAGRRPYEQVAFQFSHHRLDKTGGLAHVGQYLHTEVGGFPNFQFVRELRRSLGDDGGTFVHYAPHEATVLKDIRDQLQGSREKDRVTLAAWIDGLIGSIKTRSSKRIEMLDLRKSVLQYYWHPAMGGSNSIKKLLPAIMTESAYLRDRYGKPLYGSKSGIRSHNFKDMVWYRTDANGAPIDPYRILDSTEVGSLENIDGRRLSDGTPIADGGAAMMAYARMQFSEMLEGERQELRGALLRYCELDTLAMVMVYEAWSHD